MRLGSMVSVVVLSVVVLSVRPARASIGEALDAARDAEELNDAAESRCQAKLASKLDAVIEALQSARRDHSERALRAVKKRVKAAADVAEDRCPDRVGAPIVTKLDAVLDAIEDAGGGGDDGNDAPATGGAISAKFGKVGVKDGMYDGRAVVELNPRAVTLKGAKGRNAFFAMGVRAKNSDQIEWSTFAATEVMYDPTEWKDAGTFRFFHDWLTEHDTAGGQFVAVFAIFDNDTKEELGRRETEFTFRGGPVAMDADSFDAFLAAVHDTRTEFSKLDLVKTQLANQRIDARQLGLILDEFRNELLRLDAARAAVPRLINAAQGLVHASKFRNSLLRDDFTALFAP